MSDPAEHDIPETTTWGAHMRAIRADLSMLVQNQTRMFEHLGRFRSELNEIRSEVVELRSSIGSKLAQLSSDLIHLESQNISRHGETLSILNRLDHAGIPRTERATDLTTGRIGSPHPHG